MNRWKKRIGYVHYMNGPVTLCDIPMLGNNYAIENEIVNCPKCKKNKENERFKLSNEVLEQVKKLNDDTVTDYVAGLFHAAKMRLSEMSTLELEKFLNFKPHKDVRTKRNRETGI